MPSVTEILRQPKMLAELTSAGSSVVLALRRHVVAARRGSDSGAAFRDRCANAGYVVRMLCLVEQVAQVWPDSFTLSPPCCGRLTPDEWLLGRLAVCAGSGDRSAFEGEARDMLDGEARDALWLALTRLPIAGPRD